MNIIIIRDGMCNKTVVVLMIEGLWISQTLVRHAIVQKCQ